MKILDHDHSKCITTQEFNKLTAENFTARLKQANIVAKVDIADFIEKADFDDKLRYFLKQLLQIKQNM